MDKAGSYGIQDWMGYVGIKKIEGDFFNVMGLPLHKLYRKLKKLFQKRTNSHFIRISPNPAITPLQLLAIRD